MVIVMPDRWRCNRPPLIPPSHVYICRTEIEFSFHFFFIEYYFSSLRGQLRETKTHTHTHTHMTSSCGSAGGGGRREGRRDEPGSPSLFHFSPVVIIIIIIISSINLSPLFPPPLSPSLRLCGCARFSELSFFRFLGKKERSKETDTP